MQLPDTQTSLGLARGLSWSTRPPLTRAGIKSATAAPIIAELGKMTQYVALSIQFRAITGDGALMEEEDRGAPAELEVMELMGQGC